MNESGSNREIKPYDFLENSFYYDLEQNIIDLLLDIASDWLILQTPDLDSLKVVYIKSEVRQIILTKYILPIKRMGDDFMANNGRDRISIGNKQKEISDELFGYLVEALRDRKILKEC